MPDATLTTEALDALAQGGEPPPVPPPPGLHTAQAIHALRVLADLLATYGDVQPGEFVLPFVVNGRVVQSGKPVARALLRAGAVPGDWYGTDQLQRDIRLTFCGVEINAIEVFEGFTCGHCMDTGRVTSELLDDGETVACLACGGAS